MNPSPPRIEEVASGKLDGVLLLDLKLPKVDGLEALSAFRADPRTELLPVVVMIFSNEERDVVESYKFGANSFVVKPLDFDGFSAAVSDLGHYLLLVNRDPTHDRP